MVGDNLAKKVKAQIGEPVMRSRQQMNGALSLVVGGIDVPNRDGLGTCQETNRREKETPVGR